MAAREGPERMPISPRGKANKRPGSSGFTLIELLVVVTIISILSLGVGLGMGGVFSRGSDSPQAVADRFSDAMAQARDAALMGRAPVGMRLQRDGWALVRREAEGNWQSFVPPVAVARAGLLWVVDGRSYAPRLGGSPEQTPPLIFLPDGRSTAIMLVVTESENRVTCAANGWGEVACR